MIVVIDRTKYYDIYSDSGKKILENNGDLWNATEENPIAVNIERYNNGDYVESEEDLDLGEEEDATDEINE